jgi:hypothetical protein
MIEVTEGITPDQLREVYADARVAAVFSREGQLAEPISHPLVRYWSAFVSGRFAGAFVAIRQSAIEIEVHALLLQRAVRHSRSLAARFIDELFELDGVHRLTAWVRADFGKVSNLCRRLGFKLEGTRRMACVTNAGSHDVLMFGLLKSEWSAKWAL